VFERVDEIERLDERKREREEENRGIKKEENSQIEIKKRSNKII